MILVEKRLKLKALVMVW